MDLITFGIVGLILAVAGLLAALIIGVRDAVDRSRERRYAKRTAGRSRIAR